MLGAIRKLARRIELLAPAIDDGGRAPANCEYPWEDAAGSLRIPADYNFGIDLLHEPAGRHLLKILFTAIEDLTRKEE